MDESIQQEMVALLPRLRRFAYGLTGTIDDGDDLVQAACERAIMKIDTWQRGTRLDSWMFRIAQNLHFNNLRGQKLRRRYAVDIDAENVADTTSDRTAEGRLALAAVRQLLCRLPAEQTAVIMLVGAEGYTYKEASEILEVPVGTVMSRLARGRAALKHLMDDAPQGASTDLPESDR